MRSLNRHYFCDNCWKPVPISKHVWGNKNGVDLCDKCFWKISTKMGRHPQSDGPRKYTTKDWGFWINHGSPEYYDEKVRGPLR